MQNDDSLAGVHYQLIRGLIDEGACPANAALAQRLSVPVERVDELLRGLAEIHGVVLHPHRASNPLPKCGSGTAELGGVAPGGA